MYLRDGIDFKEEQRKHVQSLVNEGVEGITQKDVLPNSAQPLQGEVEAMYFKEMREFLENSVSEIVMEV